MPGERICDLDTLQREAALETWNAGAKDPERKVSAQELVWHVYRKGLEEGRKVRKHCRYALIISATALAIVVGQLASRWVW